MADQPSGAVTFLLAGPEGRGPGCEPLAPDPGTDEGRAAAVIRRAIEAHGGVVFTSRAADVCAAFTAAPAALAAAVAAQRALAGTGAGGASGGALLPAWTMALHTGAAQAYGGVYV